MDQLLKLYVLENLELHFNIFFNVKFFATFFDNVLNKASNKFQLNLFFLTKSYSTAIKGFTDMHLIFLKLNTLKSQPLKSIWKNLYNVSLYYIILFLSFYLVCSFLFTVF